MFAIFTRLNIVCYCMLLANVVLKTYQWILKYTYVFNIGLKVYAIFMMHVQA